MYLDGEVTRSWKIDSSPADLYQICHNQNKIVGQPVTVIPFWVGMARSMIMKMSDMVVLLVGHE